MIKIVDNKYVVVLHDVSKFGVEKVLGPFSTYEKANEFVMMDSECQKDYLFHIYFLEEREDILAEKEAQEPTSEQIFDFSAEPTEHPSQYTPIGSQYKPPFADLPQDLNIDESNPMSWRLSLANDLHDLAYHIASPKSDATGILQHAVTSLQALVRWAQNLRDGKT